MSRILVLIFLGGIGLIFMGAYDFFIQVGTSSNPTTVSIAKLEKAVPANRHLIVTGGQAMIDDAVVYYKRRRSVKVPGSEIYFIPIQDASLAAYRSLAPSLLVRITDPQMSAIKEGKTFDANAIHGVRMTNWDLDGKAEDLLAKRYGQASVKKMVIVEYEKAVTGIKSGLAQMFGGVVCIAGSVVLSALTDALRRWRRRGQF